LATIQLSIEAESNTTFERMVPKSGQHDSGSTYRGNACSFRKVIAETNGLSKAAYLLERAFGLMRKARPEMAPPVHP
jgi:hypothetical protein